MLTKPEPWRIAYFIVKVDHEPIGYSCEGQNIIRNPGETIEELQKRCIDAVIWPDCNYRHIFDPFEEIQT
jgi:hypothetical protein